MKRTVYGHLIGGLCLLSFAELAVVTKLWFPDVYPLDWAYSHGYLYLWMWVFYLTAARKEKIAVCLSAGNLLGLLLGHTAGGWLADRHMAQQAAESPDGVARGCAPFYEHAIWLGTVLFFVIAGILIQFNFFKDWKWRKQMDEDEWKRAVWAHIIGILCLVAFQFLWAFTNTYSLDMEHFVSGWTAEHHYLYCWALVCYFTGIGKPVLSVSLTLGNFAGVYLGDRAGSFFRELAMREIPWDIPNDEMLLAYQAYYQNHNGLAIWVACVFLFLILGAYIQKKGLRAICPGWLKRGLIRVKEGWLKFYNS